MDFIKITSKGNYSILQLDRGKANVLNHQLINEFRQAIQEVQNDDKAQGLILTGKTDFFSAGLDVIELYDYDKEKMRQFLIDFSMMHVELVRFPKPLICAINGHSPAGGTVIAVAADYRLMVDGPKYTIGLNEMAVNIQISHNLVNAYAYWIGNHLAHRYIMEGKLLNCQEALDAGLVDELVTAEDLLPKAEKKMKQFLNADQDIMKNTKFKLRRNWLDALHQYAEEDLKDVTEIWWKPEIRTKMKFFVDMLKMRKTAKV